MSGIAFVRANAWATAAGIGVATVAGGADALAESRGAQGFGTYQANETEKPGDPTDKGGQRYVGFGPRIGLFWGFGGGVRVGHPYVGADLGGGWQPVFIMIQKQYVGSSSSTEIEFEGWNTGQINANVYVSFNPNSRFVAGASAGYRYNSLLEHGVAVGFDGLFNLNDVLALQFNFGPIIHPAGDRIVEDELSKSGDYPGGVPDFGFPRPMVQLGLGVGLLIYP